jgi:hypothetical protein
MANSEHVISTLPNLADNRIILPWKQLSSKHTMLYSHLIQFESNPTHINLMGNDLSDEGTEMVCGSLSGEHHKVEELNLSCNRISMQGCRSFQICPIIQNPPRIAPIRESIARRRCYANRQIVAIQCVTANTRPFLQPHVLRCSDRTGRKAFVGMSILQASIYLEIQLVMKEHAPWQVLALPAW